MSYKVRMIGNNFELLDHIRIVRVTGGGTFRIFYHILLFVWKKLGRNDDPLLSKQQQKPSAKTGETRWVHLGEAGAGQVPLEK